jgi:hypothetical protein
VIGLFEKICEIRRTVALDTISNTYCCSGNNKQKIAAQDTINNKLWPRMQQQIINCSPGCNAKQ